MGLLLKVERFREIAHHYNDEADDKYQRHEKARITCLLRITCQLRRHFPRSKIAGHRAATLPKTRPSTCGMFRLHRGVRGQLKLSKMESKS